MGAEGHRRGGAAGAGRSPVHGLPGRRRVGFRRGEFHRPDRAHRRANLSSYFSFLYGKLKPGGRILNHCITRPTGKEKTFNKGGFINRYVFPDGELESVGVLVREMEDRGFEIRHQENLREHYARTLKFWCDNLEANWDEAVEEVGMGTARVWALYMAGCIVGFERNKVQLHQVLGVKLDQDGRAGMPLRPSLDWP